MKNIVSILIFTGIVCLAAFSGVPDNSQKHFSRNKSSDAVSNASAKGEYPGNNTVKNNLSSIVVINAMYNIGKIPIRIGMPDTLIVDIAKTIPGTVTINIEIQIRDRNTNIQIFDTVYHLVEISISNYILYHKLPQFFSVKNDLIIVHALQGEALEDEFADAFIDTVYPQKPSGWTYQLL